MSMRVIVRDEGALRAAIPGFVSKMVPGKPYEVWIRPFKRRRSLDQNAKMHAMIRELAKHIGYSETELKDYLKSAYGPHETRNLFGSDTVVPKSTSNYTVDEAGEMIEILYMHGAEVGCVYQDAQDPSANNGRGSR